MKRLIMHNSAPINIHSTHAAAEAIPANADNEYGWEKLYSERMTTGCGRPRDVQVRIARFQNYGAKGTWRGGK